MDRGKALSIAAALPIREHEPRGRRVHAKNRNNPLRRSLFCCRLSLFIAGCLRQRRE
jgi:hypothetical protein